MERSVPMPMYTVLCVRLDGNLRRRGGKGAMSKEFKKALRNTKRTNRKKGKPSRREKMSAGRRAIRYGTTRTGPKKKKPLSRSFVKLK